MFRVIHMLRCLTNGKWRSLYKYCNEIFHMRVICNIAQVIFWQSLYLVKYPLFVFLNISQQTTYLRESSEDGVHSARIEIFLKMELFSPDTASVHT